MECIQYVNLAYSSCNSQAHLASSKNFFFSIVYYYPHYTGKKGKMRQSFATGYSYLWSTRASNPFWCRLRLLLTLVHCVGWGVKRFRSNLIKVPREKKESEQQIVMGSWCFLRRSYSPYFMRWGRGGAFNDYVANPCKTLTGLVRGILDQLFLNWLCKLRKFK